MVSSAIFTTLLACAVMEMAIVGLFVSLDLALVWSYSAPPNKFKISPKLRQLHQIIYVLNILFCGLLLCDATREARALVNPDTIPSK